ncbi:MAG: STAS domain-containing protein [Candidatus Aquilonibacter sp.]
MLARMVMREELVDENLPWARVLVVHGELDIGAAQWFSEAIDDRLGGELPLIVDLSACQYLDSTILNVLIRSANAAPGRIGIVVPAGARIRRIFNIAGLEDALALSESRHALQVRFSS